MDKIKYGNTFQVKVLSALVSDSVFLQQINDIIEPTFFDSDSLNWTVSKIKSYWIEYKTKPTLDYFKFEFDNLPETPLKNLIKQDLKQIYTYIDSSDLPFIKNEILKFCQNQQLKLAIEDSIDLLQNEQYDAIKVKIDNALKAGIDKNVGHEYALHIEERYNEDPRLPISTGFPVIDKLAGGGLGRGELGVIVGGFGSGKSWFLTAIAAEALRQGKNVIYYTLELYEGYVAKRFDAYFSDVSVSDVDDNIDTIKAKIEDLPGNLIIKYYPTKTASLLTLSAHLEKVKNLQHSVDMVIVDYADLLKPIAVNNNKRDDQVLGDIYGGLRGLAGEFEIPLWTCSQSNRSGNQEDTEVLYGDKIASSFEKLMIADLVISSHRKESEKAENTGKLHFIKNRFGADGLTFKTSYDLSRGYIWIQDKEEVKEEKKQSSILQKYTSKFKQ